MDSDWIIDESEESESEPLPVSHKRSLTDASSTASTLSAKKPCLTPNTTPATWKDRLSSAFDLKFLACRYRTPLTLTTCCSGTGSPSIALQDEDGMCLQTGTEVSSNFHGVNKDASLDALHSLVFFSEVVGEGF